MLSIPSFLLFPLLRRGGGAGLLRALLIAVAMAGFSNSAFAEEAKHGEQEKIGIEAVYTGVVKVTKEGQAVKNIQLVIDAKTTYGIKLNHAGLLLASHDNKKIDLKGVLRQVDNALLLTAREVVKEYADEAPKK